MTDAELFKDYYTEAEVAKLEGIEVESLRNRICAHRNHPPCSGRGKSRRFPKNEYHKWKMSQLVKGHDRTS
jgi:hypothetical protein